MKYLKISIITPSYNQGEFIEKTIKSVLSQNYPNLEYIIQDNCSTDNTKKVLQKYKKSCNIIIKKDKGQVNAINNGLKIATGEIIAYLNSDDLLATNSLFIINEIFQNNPKSFITTGKCSYINQSNHSTGYLINIIKNCIPPKIRFSLPFLYLNNYIDQPATFWRKSLIKKIGHFDENLKLAADYDFFLRAVKFTKIHFLPINFAKYRIHSNQKSRNSSAQFNEVYKISCRYNKNPLIKFLCYFSCKATIFIYEIISNFSHIK